jgi:hypothetical protein
MLTRRYPEALLPRVAGRTYVQPSVDIPVAKWDYTDPEGLDRAFALGQRDAERFLRGLDAA